MLLSTFLALASLQVSKPKWNLVWHDEFDRDGLPDPKKWGYEVGLVRNNEAQYYTKARKENVRIEHGILIIEARKESYSGSEYTAGSINTLGKFTFQYGRLEVRAKLPKTLGSWPAIWMLGEDIETVGWPRCAEIDVMEHVQITPGVIYATVHQSQDGGGHQSKGGKMDLADYADAFHNYAVEWKPTGLEFFVDDKSYFTFPYQGPSTWTMDRRMYILLNLAIGGAWGGQKGIDAKGFPCRMEVDYVRVYQQKS
jgi:beta-glucanase (GH16 family)